MASQTAPPAPEKFRKRAAFSTRLPSPNIAVIVGGSAAALLIGLAIFSGHGLRQGLLYGIGLMLGYTLYHARFGFTSAFRQLLAVGQGAALRAHMLMLSVASLLFAPILSLGIGFFGVEPSGNVSPIGVSLLVGAFLFGAGMQLGGGCASGTLYAVGGGRTAVFLTLAGFIAGSVIGAWHWGFWVQKMPSLPPVSLAEDTGLGYGGALLLQLAIFGSVAGITLWVAKRRRPPEMKPVPGARGWLRIFRGAWPLWVGAILLAALNALTLTIKGEPWGITSAFALWGSKIAAVLGVDVASWAYWSGERAASLEAPILADITTVMNFGIIFGAMLAAGASGTYALRRVPWRAAVASVIGGLLMGYGARLAFGCNIGAYFGGIASFSLHGWIWIIVALGGNYAGLLLRPLFGLSNPKPTDSVC